jgi:hypothetical protein
LRLPFTAGIEIGFCSGIPTRYGHFDRLGQEVISLIDPGGVPTSHLKIKCLRAMLDSMPDNISIKDLSQDWPTAL